MNQTTATNLSGALPTCSDTSGLASGDSSTSGMSADSSLLPGAQNLIDDTQQNLDATAMPAPTQNLNLGAAQGLDGSASAPGC
jgi:hypothetical protein